ncbi:hypothetical protein GH714_019337 [Hevea brasiliensis]|uniref:mitogen-activated protein kinase n=1 Tax=Hevea brasiliensis TaxID=3981 RepID=A0A6A6MFR3_HEVBR|nr:hypothetical protein GH714_019337 [Hevea brasiliensis]
MSGPQCCANPPTLNPASGAGHVEKVGGLNSYVTGPSDSKLAIILSLMFMEKGFEDSKPVVQALRVKVYLQLELQAFVGVVAKVVVLLGKPEFIQAAVLLHPSFVSVYDIRAVEVPIAILGAENDHLSPPALLKQYEEVLAAKPEVDRHVKIFPKVAHGWTVRYNVEDETAVKPAEEAHGNLLEWFTKAHDHHDEVGGTSGALKACGQHAWPPIQHQRGLSGCQLCGSDYEGQSLACIIDCAYDFHMVTSNMVLQSSVDVDFFTEYGEGSRYRIEEVIGKGSYGVVCSAYDTHIGEKVAIKKINDIFEHVSDATRILREIKLLRLLRHPDIVEIKHILLPPSRREFKDIYVVFELMESDLHQVIKANDDLTPEHYQFFLYQLLRGLKYIHTANVFHRDLKPKNILANADCKLKICDFGLARVAFNDTPTAIFWTDYVATRWYRAPELCGSFFSKYTPAIDIWSIGCIFAELLTGKPLFPGKNVVHQLDLMTDLLGTPSPEAIARALADPYFKGLAKVEREPSAQPVTKMEFEFERRRITKEDVRELIYREILEYHPKMLKEYLEGSEPTGFMYPSAVDHFKKQFTYLEEHYGNGATVAPPERQHASLPRPCVLYSDNTVQNSVEVTNDLSKCSIKDIEKPHMDRSGGIPMTRLPLQVPESIQGAPRPGKVIGSVMRYNNCGVAAKAEALEQRRMVRNPVISTQYTAANCSYPRRNPGCKNERGEDEGVEGSSGLQPKPQYMARKVAAAQGGPGNNWY